jgi:phospholipase/carboxylesterase
MTTTLTAPSLIPITVKAAIILLHGFGSDGQDLLQLAPMLEAQLPQSLQGQVAYLAPTAPWPTPFNMGYQWFSDNNWTFRDKPGMEAASQWVWDFIDREVLQNLALPANKILILGFSQGGMVALYGVPLWPQTVGGVIGHSTALMWPEVLDRARNFPPTLLLHGTEDDVVNADAARHTHQHLEQAGFQVETHLLPNLGHGINEDSLRRIAAFIPQVFEQ